MRIDRADREVLGHPLDEPQRQPRRAGLDEPRSRSAVAGDVELEGVHQLVPDHVVGLPERAGERQHDPALEELGDAAGPLAELARDGVGLLEIGMAGVEDERLPAVELVVEHAREPLVPALGHPTRLLGGFLLRLVVVDVEVLGPQHLEVERPVLDLVTAEVLGLGHRGEKRDEEKGEQKGTQGLTHDHSRRILCGIRCAGCKFAAADGLRDGVYRIRRRALSAGSVRLPICDWQPRPFRTRKSYADRRRAGAAGHGTNGGRESPYPSRISKKRTRLSALFAGSSQLT